MKKNFRGPLKILITGPECSGKTTLSLQLAHEFKSTLISEYAREYLNALNRPYNISDLDQMCKGQLEKEDEITNRTKLLICDTGPEVIKIWSEYKYGSCSREIRQAFESRSYDLTLLCKPEMDWEPDPLREHATERDNIFSLYEDLLQSSHRNHIVIEGNQEKRKKKASGLIHQLLKDFFT